MLARLGDGQPGARDLVASAIYDQLKRIAVGQLRKERPDHTLQPTALAHEACMRLLEGPEHWENRQHLFRTAAKIMRHILTDYARKRHAGKRGGKQVFVAMGELGDVPASWRMLDL